MKQTIQRCNKYINKVANLFSTTHKIQGKFKMLFAPANDIPDSDGQTVIDSYMVPIDSEARESVATEKENFLHLQVLSTTVPEDFIGYEFEVQVKDQDNAAEPSKVESHVYNIEWKNRNLATYLFETLNQNVAC